MAQPASAQSASGAMDAAAASESLAPVHHFRVGVDLRSIRELNTPSNVFARFVYPLFDIHAPISTRPPVEVRYSHMLLWFLVLNYMCYQVQRQAETLLPNSFSAFDLNAAEPQLARVFSMDPLLIEVLHRDKMAKDM